MLGPQQEGRPGKLRMRDGKVLLRYMTLEEMRAFAAGSRVPVPPAFPDWGLEPAASSWIQLRLPLLLEPRHNVDPPLHHLYPREEREPDKSRNTVHSGSSEMTTVMIWNLHPQVDCVELRSIFEGVNGIIAVYYSSSRHVMLVDFPTRKAALKARTKVCGRQLRDCLIRTAFFSNEKYVLNRDSPLPWARPGTSLCIEGFDSSLHVEEIRTMLARHFGSDNEGIRVPTNLDGSSIGKAYIKCGSWSYFSEALNLNGSNLEGHKLSVTECNGGSRFWDGHITPNGPGTGKRKLFNNDSDGDNN